MESALGELAQVRPCLASDVSDEAALVAGAEGIVRCEPFGQPDRAEPEAAGQFDARRRAKRDLRAAAADVDDHRRVAAHADRIGRGQMDEPGLFRAGDDPDVQTDIPPGGPNELGAIARLAHGTGRGRDDFVDAVRLGEALELRKGLEGERDGGRREFTAAEAARGQADHFLLAIHDLE